MKRVMTAEGKVMLAEVPITPLPAGFVRVRTVFSAVSPGTELAAIGRCEKQPIMLGYSASGIIEELGEGASGFRVGQQVACYGAPYVGHAGQLLVPVNLTAGVPEHVGMEEAAFAGLGAIAIHAVRTADLRFGETALVVGLGVLGQMIALIANAAAFSTIAFDKDDRRAASFRKLGAGRVCDDRDDLEREIDLLTGGCGVDSVILSVGGGGGVLIDEALNRVRDRGNIVIVGDLDASFSRALMFDKEAKLLISRAGGPGRYDETYERDNRDYPIGYVRWTEGRNIAAYIRLLAENRISIKQLITHRCPVEQAAEIYDNYKSPATILGTLFTY